MNRGPPPPFIIFSSRFSTFGPLQRGCISFLKFCRMFQDNIIHHASQDLSRFWSPSSRVDLVLQVTSISQKTAQQRKNKSIKKLLSSRWHVSQPLTLAWPSFYILPNHPQVDPPPKPSSKRSAEAMGVTMRAAARVEVINPRFLARSFASR